MSSKYNQTDDFKLITYKKGGKKTHVTNIHKPRDNTPLDKETTLRRISAAKEEITTSDFYASVLASLKESIEILNQPKISQIVCFGLGEIGDSTISRYQLALLLCLKDLYKVNTFVYDPVFTSDEQDLLNSLNFRLISENLEGKYVVGALTTLFYFPHCPKQLSNNLLWANWGLNLSRCILISNSFYRIIEDNPIEKLREEAEFICKITPYTIELAVINSFKYFDIFNDTAIHIFPFEKIQLVTSDFWKSVEPTYDQDIEFINKKYL